MHIYSWQDVQKSISLNKKMFAQNSGISVGSFDGMHIGHRQLIKKLTDYCSANNLASGVVSFVRPLPSLKHSQDYKGDVSTLPQRLKLFESLGVDFVILVDFSPEFAALKGTEFFDILLSVCNLAFIAEGVDFRCGYKGSTDSAAISYWAASKAVKTDFLPPVFYKPGTPEEERISSSYIRQMITKGFFATVEELLERKYEVELENIAQITGKKIKILRSDIKQVLPEKGLYMALAEYDNHQTKTVSAEFFSDYLEINSENGTITRLIF